MRKVRLLACLVLLCLPQSGQATSIGVPVPKPTAANQTIYSGSTAPFVYQLVTLPYVSNGSQMAVGGTAVDTTSRLSVNPSGTAENGLTVTMPSGATGYAFREMSSTGVLLYGVNASGITSPGSGPSTERFGAGATTNTAQNSMAIGAGASVASGLNQCVVVGRVASATGSQATIIGDNAKGVAGSTTVGANTNNAGAIAIGGTSTVSSAGCIAVGNGVNIPAGLSNCIVFGNNGAGTAANQFVVGSSANPINNIYLGQGVSSASPSATSIDATNGSGTNISGASFTLAGGQSTGTGAEGVVNIATSGSGATGTALNALTNRVQVSQSGLNLMSGSYQANGTAGLTTTTQVTTPSGTETLHFTSGLLTSVTTP